MVPSVWKEEKQNAFVFTLYLHETAMEYAFLLWISPLKGKNWFCVGGILIFYVKEHSWVSTVQNRYNLPVYSRLKLVSTIRKECLQSLLREWWWKSGRRKKILRNILCVEGCKEMSPDGLRNRVTGERKW